MVHAQRLWQVNRIALWELAFAVLASPSIPEVGKLLVPSVIAQYARNVDELRPLVESSQRWQCHPEGARACSASVPAGHPSYQRCDHERIFSNALGGTSCDSHRHYDGEPAYSTRPLVWWLAEHFATLSTSEQVSVGIVARRILIFALETNDQNLLSPAVTMTAKTAPGTPNESIATLRRCISPERLAQDGYLTLRALSAAVLVLLPVDTDFVRESLRRCVRLSRDKHGRYFD